MTIRTLLIVIPAFFIGCVDEKAPGGPDAGTFDASGPRADTGSECNGCLSPSGACLAGDQTANCGAGGNACTTCGSGEECADGECRMPPACDSSNCSGCCDGDTCVEAPDDTRCGAGGAECTTCTAPATCQAGACANPCDAMSCGGCCGADGCVPVDEQDDDECGTMGAACGGCATGEVCVDGACVDSGCMASCAGCCDGDTCVDPINDLQCGAGGSACIDCGAGRRCEAGACTTNLDSMWDVVAVSGVVPERDLDGDAWDAFGGLPDAVVRIVVGGEGSGITGMTMDQPNTTTPAWNETVVSGVTARQLIESALVIVLDEDAFGFEEIGRCTVAYGPADFPSVMTWTCSPDPMSEAMAGWQVTLRVEPSAP